MAVEITVTGHVQGVSFRWYAEQEAARLGVAGWVRNETDGSVRLHVEGAPDAVDAMVRWCGRGSPSATVDDVAVTDATDATDEGTTGFEVRA